MNFAPLQLACMMYAMGQLCAIFDGFFDAICEKLEGYA